MEKSYDIDCALSRMTQPKHIFISRSVWSWHSTGLGNASRYRR